MGTSGEMEELCRRLEIMDLIFDSIHHGSMVTDPEGRVTHFNRPYGQFLGVEPNAQIGKHCTEVVGNSRMPLVGQTGKAEINHTHLIKGQRMVVQRIPIKKDGKVIAVFGQVMFKDVRDVTKLAKKLSLLESKLALYEQEIISLRSSRHTLESIAGESPAIRTLKREALRAADNQLPILITGESGTGKDLFYRLNVIPLSIPPLRERREDIAPTARHLLRQMAAEASLPEIRFSADAEEALYAYDWPGNVRELCNVLERVLSSLEGDTIQILDLPFHLYRGRKTAFHQNKASLRENQMRMERETIRYSLAAAKFNKARAANMLGIHRTLLYKKMQKYSLPLRREPARTQEPE